MFTRQTHKDKRKKKNTGRQKAVCSWIACTELHVKVKLLWCDHFDVQRKKYSKDKVFQIGFIVNSKKVKAKTYNGKKKKSRLPMGKGEMKRAVRRECG